jgi:hypothetical protein
MGRHRNQLEQRVRTQIKGEIDTYLDALLGRQGQEREEVIRLIAARVGISPLGGSVPRASVLTLEQRMRLVREELESLFPPSPSAGC